ncbi:MAG: hypothetical protein AABX35_04585 [Nanoarchaeota archaeon]
MGDDVERIVVKKFHLKNVALFGLYHGLLVGLILGIMVLIAFFSFTSLFANLPPTLKASTTSDGFVLAFIVFVSYTVFSVITSVIWALIYNLVSKMGGSIHFGLVEAEKAVP